MITYKKEDLSLLKKDKEDYYMPHALFDTMQYKLIRLEVKWAYVACLNALIKTPSYDQEGNAYVKDDHPLFIDYLKDLAHKEVDREKMYGYIDELEECGLLKKDGRNLYIKKIDSVF